MVETNNDLQVGSIVTGTVIKIDEKQVFVDIGYKTEGIIPISELSNLHVENPGDVVRDGEELTLQVKKIDDDEVVLSKKMVDAEKAWKDLQHKFDQNEVFETEVKEVVKGGLVVDIGLRGFIPASLVETYFVEDFSDYKNKTLAVKIVDLDQEQNRVILSHRAVMEEEQEKKKQDLLQSLQKGQVVEGTVQRITTFGAFVDIGGVDGLVHISELAHTHVEKVSDVLTEGDNIKVEILSVDLDNERISLSYKNTLPGPWSGIEGRIKEGDQVEGIVKRIVSFGAFIEIETGVEGLVHISQIANRHIGTPEEVLKVGDKVSAKVLSVSEQDERISLSMKEIELEKEKGEIEQYEKEEDFSSFQLGDMIGDKLDKYKK
ncbi:30S ribosomal protein S1 [Pseudogracilibacillus auburnensis]|uniref:SSU ribosomal protein S1P n=1 Tax=Pseudogracilibacillus auburnensis TaxID=1494959 RepID=A0A2V3W3R2_9BACI|nr:30S ribosomal protein S1 [Pseudogracilibacillus auburnensis]MBO1003064.1 30S ribosomal protein S1 [Pseudogracilibacillus auburnensis]PXW88732.1 SSU ribosomal protein S1P [Pseudogracilibacillus auburnensis]